MWLLHVVHGGSFATGVTLRLTCCVVALGFALYSGEFADPNALLVDPALAAIGGVGVNLLMLPIGADPVALIYAVRVFSGTVGALLVLCLAHEAVRHFGRPEGERRRLVIGETGAASPSRSPGSPAGRRRRWSSK